MRLATTLFASLLLAGCASAPPTAAPRTPEPAPAASPAPAPLAATPPPPSDPFALPSGLRDEPAPRAVSTPPGGTLGPAPKGVAEPDAACAAYAKRSAKKPPTCSDTAAALARLDEALTEPDATKRDERLVAAEACTALPPGLVRALRAELAPRGCGDAIIGPLLASPPPALTPDVHHALLGLALGARLARTVGPAPKLAPPLDKERVKAHLAGPMSAWIREQVLTIEEISRVGVSLSGYGKGVVAIEAGLAEMRFVDAVRNGPLPEDFAKDSDIANVYFAALDEALEPRKARGRDAALVGLKELSFLGVLRDERVARARKLLSEIYGGRRVDALDGLLVPPLAKASPSTAEERLAASLPTFYAGLVLAGAAAEKPSVLRALLERGVPTPARVALRAAPKLPAEMRALYARARLDLGRAYWRTYDFDQAAALAAETATGESRGEEATFLLALALGLRGGPEDVAQLMRRAPLEALGLGATGALDAVVTAGGPLAGMAAFDAAYLRELATPHSAGAAHFRDIAERYRKAASLLADPAQKRAAEERAHAADMTADAIR